MASRMKIMVYLKFFLLKFLLLLVANVAFTQHMNITAKAGISHAHAQESLMGGGATFIDYNGDGWLDIVMTGGDVNDRLYLNRRDGTFEDHSFVFPHNEAKNVNTSGVICGDINNDGCEDLFFTTFSSDAENILLQNNCDGTYTNISKQAGINHQRPSIGAAFFDFDLDGLLDIYVINYIDSLIFEKDSNNVVIGFDHLCSPHLLYHNLGKSVFEEVADQLDVAGSGCALAVAPIHFTNRERGVYIANDFGEFIKPNEYFQYDETSQSFIEVSAEKGVDIALYGMGVAVGDFDQDLDFDLYITNMGQNAFLVNNGGHFEDRALQYNVDNTFSDSEHFSTGWGTFFYDYNNDSHMDLFVANGFVPAAPFLPNALIDPCILYENRNGRFFDVTSEQNIDVPQINRGCIYGDFDNDGDLDLVVTNTIFGGDPDEFSTFKVLENNLDDENHYLDISLKGVSNNRNGFGANIYVAYEGKSYVQHLLSGGTHASQSSQIIHFGLGKQELIDSIWIVWPNGLRDTYYDTPVDQHLLIQEGRSKFDILGCMDETDPLYNPLATLSSGCARGSSTSVLEKDETDVVSIYPTITRGYVSLSTVKDLGEVEVAVYNMYGQKCHAQMTTLYKGDNVVVELPCNEGMLTMQIRSLRGEMLNSVKVLQLK